MIEVSMIEHREQKLDRHEKRDSRPTGQRSTHRVVTTYRDIGREAGRRADDQCHPRQRSGATPGAAFRQDVERRDQLKSVHAERERRAHLRAEGESAEPAAPTVEAGEAGTPDAGLPPEKVPPDVIPQPVP
jgi:hypothetical protein